jgi:hypothetical protein
MTTHTAATAARAAIVVDAPIERAFSGWEAMRDAVGSPNGWSGGLKLFAAAAAA